MEGNPYDGHTLSDTLTIVNSVTIMTIADSYVDNGDDDHGYTGKAEIHIAGQRNGCDHRQPKRT